MNGLIPWTLAGLACLGQAAPAGTTPPATGESSPPAKGAVKPADPKAAHEKKSAPAPRGIRRISPNLSIDTTDPKAGRVLVETQIVFREGPIELLLCPKRTKEHESILAAELEPRQFQLAMLLSGAKPGAPAKFEPFKPPTGQKLKIEVEWKDKEGKTQRADIRDWIKDAKTGKRAECSFVFAGSDFFKAPNTERLVFLGDDGDLVCVSNFPGSIIDVGQESSKDNSSRLFEAMTEKIPPIGTKVTLIITPLPDDPKR
jgi:hypothetical protein